MAKDNEQQQPTVKQGAVTPRTLRASGFRGAYLDARFDDEGVSVEPVSAETEAALKKDFPRLKITAVTAKATDETEDAR